MKATRSAIHRALDQGKGILRLAPTWVPRSFCVPGRRIKLHPDDYYVLGGERGGIDERWLASTTPADNGPLTDKDEGLSNVVVVEKSGVTQLLLRDVVQELKGALIGARMWNEHQCWPMYSKFFDNMSALPHHIHHGKKHAAAVSKIEKPEAYYFPPQLNNHGGHFPFMFFGLEPGTTRAMLKTALENFTRGDNKLTNLSRAYRLEVGTGWDVPPGLLHAPGSLCTYEPQKASDVFAMYQSLTGEQIVPTELLWKDTPPHKKGDFDYLVSVLDWELNVDPKLVENRFMRPRPAHEVNAMRNDGHIENWICYKSTAFSAKELTVLPGAMVTIKDGGPYGMILTQGHGKMGVWEIETPALIRFGQLTRDEFFISAQAAAEGVVITNASDTDPLVMLKHFGPDNPELKIPK
jgi:hypothetical protein